MKDIKEILGMGDNEFTLGSSEIYEPPKKLNCAYGKCTKNITDGSYALITPDGSAYCSHGCQMLALTDGDIDIIASRAVQVRYKSASTSDSSK